MTDRHSPDLSPGAADSKKLKAALQTMRRDEAILVEPTKIDALADDLLDGLEGRSLDPGAADRLYELLMEHDEVEDLFISKDELADFLRD